MAPRSRVYGGSGCVLAALFLLLAVAGSADASFPGQNGRLVYERTTPVYTANVDGSDEQQLTPDNFAALEPSWSANGLRIAVNLRDNQAQTYNEEIYVMNADGSGLQNLTNDPANDFDPAWSPGGDQLVFNSARNGTTSLMRMNADGTGQTAIGGGTEAQWSPDGTKIAFRNPGVGIATINPSGSGKKALTSGTDTQPNWSPDGRKVVFARYVLRQPCDRFCDPYISYELWSVNADGSDERRLTSPPGGDADVQPVWAPDGSKILFSRYTRSTGHVGLFLMNPDGTGVQEEVPSFTGYEWDWQSLPVNTPSTHVRPKGATPFQASLVPAFAQCASPDRTHGAPLAFPSCTNPRMLSTELTIGATDAGQGTSRSVGWIRFDPEVGAAGPPDDTDVQFHLSVTNVMRSADLSDYAGELEGSMVLRITDKDGAVSSTRRDLALSFGAQCAPTADPQTGATCTAATSADAVMPGLAPEGMRSVWSLDHVEVRDGGPDGDADTSPNAPFLRQGIFAP